MKTKQSYTKIVLGLFSIVFGISFSVGQEKKVTYKEKYRPQYHFSLPDRWIGDPTGMFFYQGEHYLNYGEGITDDFVHWKFGEPKFQRREGVAMMSGSAVFDKNNTSGFGTKDNPPIVAIYSELRHKDIMQFQSVSYSLDGGKTFTPYKNNPVIDINNTEFRDPTVFWYAPEEKWIMIVAMAAETKVHFYGSYNLKDWDFLSEFGPKGVQQGVWECPDIFPLPVNGDPNNVKWVLEVDVQPLSGQYFVGDFDGEKFVIDPSFEKQINYDKYNPGGEVLFDFENNLSQWEIKGDAFNQSPALGPLENQGAILNIEGSKLVNTFYNGDRGKGSALSPEFTIQKSHINFLIGGGNHPEKLAVNLIVDGEVVNSTSGINTETLTWTGWDVKEFKNKKARIEIVDDFDGGFGHILVDHIMQSDQLAVNKREKGPWIDYGPDFYAVRSWQHRVENGNRRIWIAWMNNWLYARDLPTKPFHGIQSIPRSVSLVHQQGEYELLQQPVKELKELRGKHFQLKNHKVSRVEKAKSIQPKQNTYELVAEIDLGDSDKAGLNLNVGKGQKTIVYFDKNTDELVLDRSTSGETDFGTSFANQYRAPMQANNNKIKLHIFVDASSIEVFGSNGSVVLSALIFPDPTKNGIELFATGGEATFLGLDVWELNSIWDE